MEIGKQWRRNEGVMKMLGKEASEGDNEEVDLLSTVVYLVENEKTEQLQSLDFSRWCATCLLYKRNGTKHCSICNRCVPYYSHHSLVYNRCIFQHNHFFFMMTFLCQWVITALYLLRIHLFYIQKTQSLNPWTLALKILELDKELWFIFYSLLFLDFAMNTKFLYYEMKGITLNLTQNELKNIGRYKYIDLSSRRPQGVVNNVINFVADRVMNARLI